MKNSRWAKRMQESQELKAKVREYREKGLTLAAIGEKVGVSMQRIHQILTELQSQK